MTPPTSSAAGTQNTLPASHIAPEKLRSRWRPPVIDPREGDVGYLLKGIFDRAATEALPSSFVAALARLEATGALAGALSDADFKQQLTDLVPNLRGFGRSLTGSRDNADDLAQETMMKAWAARARYQAGTSMRAWTFIIMRNLFLSQMRRRRFSGEYNELQAERILVAPADQQHSVHLADLQRAMETLPLNQREALILVGAGGFSYEDAATICRVAVGTIKSRVARARTALAVTLAGGRLAPRKPARDDGLTTVDEIMHAVEQISSRRRPDTITLSA
jgi:RNA polymerase sigma-70 factor (ECF subfamily)